MDKEPEESLDPEDWSSVSAVAHKMVDDAIDHLSEVRGRPVWRQMPKAVQATFETTMALGPTHLEDVYGQLSTNMTPYAMGNIHSMFWV